jgi:hypothetical protein
VTLAAVVRRVLLACAALCALAASVSPAAASAFGAVGTDPTSNIGAGELPYACWSAPTGATCEDAAVAALQHSRAAMGQPSYALPSGFTSLTGPQQALVLTNLDRALYGLPPVAGLVSALNVDAAVGVVDDADPSPSAATWTGWTANWAGGMPNMVAAYQMWMYDDGPGSANLDCPPAGGSGCWGHRHDILWQFDSVGPLVMGAAVGNDRGGSPGYAMLLVSERSGVAPAYTYTWSTPTTTATTTASAGGRATTTAVRPRVTNLSVKNRRVSVTVAAPAGAKITCAMSVFVRGHYVRDKFVRCSANFAYVRVPKGRYRLRVRVGSVTLTRYLVVR